MTKQPPELIDFPFDFSDFYLSNYLKDEQRVLTLQLTQAGYTIEEDWYSSDFDSFGPLVRSILLKKYNQYYLASYG